MATIPTTGISQNGLLLDGFEDASDWTNFGSTAPGFAIADNPNTFLEGTQSLNFSATGSGNVRFNRFRAEGFDLSGIDTFTLWVDWDKVHAANNISVYMSAGGNADLSNSSLVTLFGSLTGTLRPDGGRMAVTWFKSDMSIAGGTGVDFSNVTNVNILCNMAAGAESINIDSLVCGRRTRPKVVMCFDDGVEDGDFSQIDAAAIANARNIPVSLHIIPRLIDGAGFLTKSELTTLQAGGNLIAAHSDVDGDGSYALAGSTPAEVTADIQTVRSYLVDNGFSAGKDFFAWPGGAYLSRGQHNGSSNVAVLSDSLASWTVDQFVGEVIHNLTDDSNGTITANTATTITATLSGGTDDDWDAADVYLIGDINYIQAAEDAGLRTARSITGVVQTNNTVEKIQLGLIEPMIINASSMDIGSGATSIVAMTAELDKAISQGTTIFFYVHKISAGALEPATFEITGDDFTTMCDVIEARVDADLIDSVRYDDWFNSLSVVVSGGIMRPIMSSIT